MRDSSASPQNDDYVIASPLVILSEAFVILSEAFVILSEAFVILSEAKDLARLSSLRGAEWDPSLRSGQAPQSQPAVFHLNKGFFPDLAQSFRYKFIST